MNKLRVIESQTKSLALMESLWVFKLGLIVDQAIPFCAAFFKHPKLALIELVNVPMSIFRMTTNGRISMISNALK